MNKDYTYYDITVRTGIPSKFNLKNAKEVEKWLWNMYEEDNADEKIISINVVEVENTYAAKRKRSGEK